MPQYQTWEEFSRAAEKLYLADPMKVNPRGTAASAPGQDVIPMVRAACGASPAPPGGAGCERRRTLPGVVAPTASSRRNGRTSPGNRVIAGPQAALLCLPRPQALWPR